MGDARLANEVNRIVNQPGFLHRSNIRNWRSGEIKRVGNWRQVVAIAHSLHLNEVEADQLLRAAGHRPIRQLWPEANEKGRQFLIHWVEQSPLRDIDDSLKQIREDVREIKEYLGVGGGLVGRWVNH